MQNIHILSLENATNTNAFFSLSAFVPFSLQFHFHILSIYLLDWMNADDEQQKKISNTSSSGCGFYGFDLYMLKSLWCLVSMRALLVFIA